MRWNFFSCRALKSNLPTPSWLWCNFEEEEMYLFLFCWGESLWTGASVQQLLGKQWRWQSYPDSTGPARIMLTSRHSQPERITAAVENAWSSTGFAALSFRLTSPPCSMENTQSVHFLGTEVESICIKRRRVDQARRGARQQNSFGIWVIIKSKHPVQSQDL